MSNEYFDAPLEPLVKTLLGKYDELAHCQTAKIKYLFKSSEHSKYLGKCNKAQKKWRHLTGFHYVIEIWREWWEGASDTQKEALLYHELRHVEKVVKVKKGVETIKWKIRRHDEELFLEEIRRYGAWNPSLTALAKIMAGDIKEE